VDKMSKLIEKGIPYLAKINELGLKEASFIRISKIHNLHYWPARRPAGLARIFVASTILPADISNEEFSVITGLSQVLCRGDVIYLAKPSIDKLKKYVNPAEITVCDPMAGGGSIPLEAARMGFNTIAIEYNPVAYLILKATIEYPRKYGMKLFNLVVEEAQRFVNEMRKRLSRFYGPDAENYIFARGVRCPNCDGLIPIAGVFPEITKKKSFRRRFIKIEFDKNTKTFKIKTTDEKQDWKLSKVKRKGDVYVKCPYCGQPFKLRGRGTDHAFARWFREHAELMKRIVEDLESVTPELEQKLLELHIPLVKQVGQSFVEIDEEEKERFIEALRELSRRIYELQPYIPMGPIPEENQWARTARNLGITKWYMLFNPRQLLTIAEMIKYIAERIQELSRQYGELGIATLLYLALALDKIADYNTLATKWQGSEFKTGIGDTIRGESTIDFRLEYCEMVVTLPQRSLEWALEIDIAKERKFSGTAGGILPVLRFLCEQFEFLDLRNDVRIIHGDATILSSILGRCSVDVVNVDPPYFDQVIYSDKMELFWVVLRRALMPVLDKLFDECYVDGWSWRGSYGSRVPRSREVVARKSGERFRRMFIEFVDEVYKVLKDDGMFVLWFTHPRAEAWYTIGEALCNAGFVVKKVYPVFTEMPTRYKKQVNKIAQQVTLIIVAKKEEKALLGGVRSGDLMRSLIENDVFVNAVRESIDEVRKSISGLNVNSADVAAMIFSSALGVVTRFSLPFTVSFERIYKPAITLAITGYFEPLIAKILSETGRVRVPPDKAQILSDYIEKRLLTDDAARSFLSLWMMSHVGIDGKVLNETLPLGYDFAQTVSKLCGYDIRSLQNSNLIFKLNSDYKLAYVPDLVAGRIKVDIKTFLKTSVGRAIYLTYLASIKGGTPAIRAQELVKDGALYPYLREIAYDASLALILLSTASDSEIAPIAKKIDVNQLRRLISETLIHLIIGSVPIEIGVGEKPITLDDFLR